MLAGTPQVMSRLRVPEKGCAANHPLDRLECGVVQWNDSLARLVLARPDVNDTLGGVEVLPAHILHFDAPHGGVRRKGGGAVDVFPLWIGFCGLEQALLLFVREHATNRLAA